MIPIVLSTCDDYSDVLDLFLYTFALNWPIESQDVYVNCESVGYLKDFQDFKILNITHSRHMNWGERVLSTVGLIDSEFFIFLLDDYVLNNPVSREELDKAVSLLKANPMHSCVYLHYSQKISDNAESVDYKFIRLNQKVNYRFNTLPAIWRREHFLQILRATDDPWSWEAFAMYRCDARNMIALSVSSCQHNIYHYSSTTGGLVYRGIWVKEALDAIRQKYDLIVDCDRRGIASFAESEIKRSLLWKAQFVLKGLRIAGLRSINFYLK